LQQRRRRKHDPEVGVIKLFLGSIY
jgi:hypothetical protein